MAVVDQLRRAGAISLLREEVSGPVPGSGCEGYVMLRPSGVQVGQYSEVSSVNVRRDIGPSGSSLVQISKLPSSHLANAIRVSSGENRKEEERPTKSPNVSPALTGLTAPERVTQMNSFCTTPCEIASPDL